MLPLSISCLLAIFAVAESFPFNFINHKTYPDIIAQEVSETRGSSNDAADNGFREWSRRRKRYVVRKKRWTRKLLTWRLDTSNVKPEDEYVIRATLHRAFQEWSSASSVRFEEVETSADMVIGFERGKHEDAFPFDGKDGIVAHAFYPRDGRLHFDADEDWSLNSVHGVNLFQTAVHEIGHLLGLEHSVDPRAVMFSARRPYDPDFSLGDDDVRAIRVLFPLEDERTDSYTTEPPGKTGETSISQVVENLHGGYPTTLHEITPSDELTFPFPLPPFLASGRKLLSVL